MVINRAPGAFRVRARRYSGKIFVCIFVCFFSAQAQDSSIQDTLRGSVADLGEQEDTLQKSVYSPVLTGAASLGFPGLGQVYSRRYVKGGLYFATETIMGLVAYNGYDYYRFRQDLLQATREETRGTRASFERVMTREQENLDFDQWLEDNPQGTREDFQKDSVGATNRVRSAEIAWQNAVLEQQLDEYAVKHSRRGMYNSLLWLGGTHVYNVMDALASSQAFHDDQERRPTVAGMLSAVPFLGLGQVYNKALSKAGLVFMTQSVLAGLAYNYDYLRTQAENQLLAIEQSETLSPGQIEIYRTEWRNRQRTVLRLRNTYIWYWLLFYMYGIFDAVVDAHLHDIDQRMRLTPDLAVLSNRAGLRLELKF